MATSRALRRAYDDALQETGLNQSEASVLALLAEEGSLSQTAVAHRIGMRRAAAGTIVEKLEGLGLVRRSPDPTDGRIRLLSLTDKSRPFVRRILQIDTVLRQQLRSGISRDERKSLAMTLEQIRANLAKLDARL
ncbi:MAG: MarR family winged helix-turn-helix transcriptional regulator [Acidimicrobiia bacterium]